MPEDNENTNILFTNYLTYTKITREINGKVDIKSLFLEGEKIEVSSCYKFPQDIIISHQEE